MTIMCKQLSNFKTLRCFIYKIIQYNEFSFAHLDDAFLHSHLYSLCGVLETFPAKALYQGTQCHTYSYP